MLTSWVGTKYVLNTLRPRQNGRHFADDPFKRIFLNENVWISLKISLKFVARVRINNIPALVPIMACRRSGDKPLSKPMMVSLLTHICVTRPQWVNKHADLGLYLTTGIQCHQNNVMLQLSCRLGETTWNPQSIIQFNSKSFIVTQWIHIQVKQEN